MGLTTTCISTALSSATGWSSTTSWGAGSDVGKKFFDILSFESLSEEAWPVGFDLVSTCLDNLAQFFVLKRWSGRGLGTYINIESTVVEEESSVCAYKLVFFDSRERAHINTCHFLEVSS